MLDSGGTTNGLVLGGGNSLVRGLSIINFTQAAIQLQGKSNNVIEGNYLGLPVAGITASPAGSYGVYLNQSDHNQIGGAPAAVRNVIVGRTYGVYIYGEKSTYNKVQGNTIGLDASGSAVAQTSTSGVDVHGGSYNTIGGTKPGEGNVIAGSNYGIQLHSLYSYLEADYNVIQGNFIGTDTTGTIALGVGTGIYTDIVNHVVIGAKHPRGSACTAGCNLIVGRESGGTWGIRSIGWDGIIVGNFVGTDVTGTVPLGKLRYGIEASGTTEIGQYTDDSGNLIANYSECGVRGNSPVSANFIGTDVTGSVDLTSAPRAVGICIIEFSNGIGGTSYSETGGGCHSRCNLISGNWAGIHFTSEARSVSVSGNYIGTNAKGDAIIGNQYGILLEGAERIFIGDFQYDYPHGNLIGGNDIGILINNASAETFIHDNLIGLYYTTTTGYVAIPNRIGIEVRGASTATSIGGSASSQGNIIAGNLEHGIYLWDRAASSSIIGNTIGIQAAPNGQHGILIGQNQGSGNSISGQNVIAYNRGNGITLVANANVTNGVLIAPNSVHSNGGLGIDLGNDGITPNDAGDADTGPNGRQNFPILTSIAINGNTTVISGMLNTTPNTPITLRFFMQSRCDPTTFGEGETYFHSFNLTTDATGQAAFTTTVSSIISTGYFVTATASTNYQPSFEGDPVPAPITSEFSACMMVRDTNTFIVLNTNDSGPGSFRQAILDANDHPGADRILFSITGTGSGPHLIQPRSALPTITAPVYVNACSQPNADCSHWPIKPAIQLDGSLAGPGVDGFVITTSYSSVTGLAITRFSGYGIRITGPEAQNNHVSFNFIGTDPTGLIAEGNQSGGVLIEAGASRNVIGQPWSDGVPINQIAYNGVGVRVSGDSTLDNTIANTMIYANTVLGIDLGNDGPTPNDENDADEGPNHHQNTPLITSLESRNGTRIQGEFHSTPNAVFELHVYALPSCSAVPQIELSSVASHAASLNTDENGHAAIDLVLHESFPVGYGVIATATDVNGNTSELSPCLTVGESGPSTVVTTTHSFGPGSFYQAILDANALPGQDTITFAIPGSGQHVIPISNSLPAITESVIIDGTTQPGASCASWPPTLMIMLDGTMLTTNDPGLLLAGNDSVVRGLVIAGFKTDGIRISGNRNQVACSFIGMDVTGLIRRANIGSGISIIGGTTNLIGTNSDGVGDNAERNLIAGNGSANISISGSETDHNVVAGNIIGTDVTGVKPVSNANGVLISNGTHHNRIGTDGDDVADDLERNIISGQSNYGIQISGLDTSYNIVAGNTIGSDLTSTLPIGNRYGILLGSDAQYNRIGTDGSGNGFDSHEANVIVANNYGILLLGSTIQHNVIAGNFIGTDVTGTLDLGNILAGIQFDVSNELTLVGTNRDGVADDLEGNLIYYNGSLGGVIFTKYGGSATLDGNTIAFNDGPGIALHASNPINNAILSNSIHSNGGLGIDLGNDGPTLNDVNDNDTGPNSFQNYPELTAVIAEPTGVLKGTLHSQPNTTYTLQFFSQAECDPSGFGEGKIFRGQMAVTTDGTGEALFEYALAEALAENELFTATATDPSSNTSEFSPCRGAVNQPPEIEVPGMQVTAMNESLIFSNTRNNVVRVLDPDAGWNAIQVTLSANEGTLTLSRIGGLTFSEGDGTGDMAMTFTGTTQHINRALNGLIFTPGVNYLGEDILTISADDQGHSGPGGALTDTDTVLIEVEPRNQPPVNTVPGVQSIDEDTSLVFSTANGNAISISDPDAGANPVQVKLSAGYGTLTLSGVIGLTFDVGDGIDDPTMTFTGTFSAINAALNDLVFTPSLDFNGSVSLIIMTNDQGYTGLGGPLSDTDSMSITVNPVNDPPMNTVPGNQDVDAGVDLVFNSTHGNPIQVVDPDAASEVMSTLSVTAGSLTLSSTTGLTFTSGDGTNDAMMTFVGPLSSINTALNGLRFRAGETVHGDVTLTLTSSDQGFMRASNVGDSTVTIVITVDAGSGPLNFIVNKMDDHADGFCDEADCTLREAVIASNTIPGSDTITIPAGTYTLTMGSELSLTSDTALVGAGAATTIVQASTTYDTATHRVMSISSGATVSISGLTIRYGKAETGGGGVSNGGMLTIDNCRFLGNSGTDGGAIYNDGLHDSYGTVIVTNSIFSGNSANGSSGGGIYNLGRLTVAHSTFSGNSANDAAGGGISNASNLTVVHSTFSNNSAMWGGGIYLLSGTLTVINSTLSGNSAGDIGGGILHSWGTTTVVNSTLIGNSASDGGGIRSFSGLLTIFNSIVANSPTGGNCVGTITDGGNNLSSDDTCGFDLLNTDPLLGPLADNGGLTHTHLLLPGSPAIDAGDNTVCADPDTVNNLDQRGEVRPFDGNGDGTALCDIGAVERREIAIPVLSINSASGFESSTGTITFTVSRSSSDGTSQVDYTTTDGTATAGSDYIAAEGMLTFEAGESSKTIVVHLLGDSKVESSETFVINLINPQLAEISEGQGHGTITNSTPKLRKPAQNAFIRDTTPTFRWNTISSAVRYQLQVDNDSTFSSPLFTVTSTVISYTRTKALADGRYYSRLRARDAAGNWGGWSPRWSFMLDTIPPDGPVLQSPANGATIANPTPIFRWNAVTGAARYTLQVDNNSDFSSPVINRTLTTTAYTPDSALVARTYYWRVRAYDKAGNLSSWSTRWSFRVTSGAVMPPATDVPASIPTPTATITSTETPTLTPTPTEVIASPTPTEIVIDTLLRVESDQPAVQQTGVWTAHITDVASGGSYLYSSGSFDDELLLNFVGTQVKIIYVKHPALGMFAVEIDGAVMQLVTSGAPESEFGVVAVVNGLAAGPHTLKVYPVAGVVALDAFGVEALNDVVTTPTPTDFPPAQPTFTPMPSTEPTLTPTTTNTPLLVTLPFIETFDSGLNWLASGSWTFDIQTAYRGAGWFVESAARGLNSTLTLIAPIDLRMALNPELSFWQKTALVSQDIFALDVSLDGGLSWQTLNQQAGGVTDWTPHTLDLRAYRGQVISLRFRLDTLNLLPEGAVTAGVWIDELVIQEVLATPTPSQIPTDIPPVTDLPTSTPVPPTATEWPTDVPTSTPVPTDTPTEAPTETPVPDLTEESAL